MHATLWTLNFFEEREENPRRNGLATRGPRRLDEKPKERWCGCGRYQGYVPSYRRDKFMVCTVSKRVASLDVGGGPPGIKRNETGCWISSLKLAILNIPVDDGAG